MKTKAEKHTCKSNCSHKGQCTCTICQSKHTPTPQELHLRAVLSDKDYSPERIEEIVRAVNSHEALLEAAKAQRNWMKRAWALLSVDQRGYCGFLTPHSNDEVVAQAEGGK